MSLFDLSGRVALVTGGNGGIGLGMAKGMAAAGAAVAIAGRDAKKAEAALAQLGPKATSCRSRSQSPSRARQWCGRRSRASAGSTCWSTTPA
jgi:NAD(P)-dependent dehydrogenase (short-subunit alcohol dehydrogenase family)